MNMPTNIPANSKACLMADRGVLRVGGEGRRDFLQGLISNDIALCAKDSPIYAALLTPQGKFLHEFFLFDDGDSLLMDCTAGRIDELLQKLTAYKLRAKVTLENISPSFNVWAFPDGGAGFTDPRLPELGTRGIFEKTLQHKDSGADIYEAHRLALGVTDDRDMTVGKSSLLDGNFDFLNGIDWKKGCYVGQELTARMHHRGLAKKRLFPVKIEGIAPALGTILRHGDNEIGEMRSANATHGLALLNIEMAKAMIVSGEAIVSENAKLSPFQPHWLKT